MDIEPLWALGGWFLLQNCMAAPKTPTSISEIHTKLHPFLLLLSLFFIFLLLFTTTSSPSSNPTNPSMASTVIYRKRALLDTSGSASSTANFNPNKARKSPSSSKPTRTEFGAEEHEVPSGPNPISN